MEFVNEVVNTKNGDIPTTLIKQRSDSNKLAVILPGAGYTVNAPLLHYSTGLYLYKGYDVLHVKYSYPKDVFSKMSEEAFSEDVKIVIDQCLDQYNELTVVAKSLGTIVLASLQEQLNISCSIWLTPLIQTDYVYEKMLSTDQKGLVLIGDQDPCYIEERYQKLAKKSNLTTHLIPNTNHALEYEGDVLNSVNVLKDIVHIINDYNS